MSNFQHLVEHDYFRKLKTKFNFHQLNFMLLLSFSSNRCYTNTQLCER